MPQQNVAVLDLGSNSFHMLIAKLDENKRLQIVDKLKDTVRLAAGLDENNYIRPDTQERVRAFFHQYAERVRGFQPHCVRVVATDTFRRAKNGMEFLEEAQTILGFPIEIISGMEEARLIYQGVSHDFPSRKRRLVIDIGGGSTELIIGTGAKALELASTKMGCVVWTNRFFADGNLDASSFTEAIAQAGLQLEPQIRKYQSIGWHEVLGSSGTMKAVSDIILEKQRGFAQPIHPENIDTNVIYESFSIEDVAWIIQEMQSVEHKDKIPWTSISPDRKEVLAGGVSILYALMQNLQIQRIYPTTSALREGVVVEMVGRIFGEDVREKSVLSFQSRFKVDKAQSNRVYSTIQTFVEHSKDAWNLTKTDTQMLQWATMLHEIGLTISFSGYHKHSAYMVANADLAGFTKREQSELALLLLAHRSTIKIDEWRLLHPNPQPKHLRMIALLRLAMRIHRKRDTINTIHIYIQVLDNQIILYTPDNFVQLYPLLQADLVQETQYLAQIGITLSLQHTPTSS